MEKGAPHSDKASQYDCLALSLNRERVISTGRRKPNCSSPTLNSAPPPLGEGPRTLEIRPKDGLVDFFLVQAGANRELSSGVCATLEVFLACDWSNSEVCGQAATESAQLHFGNHIVNSYCTLSKIIGKLFSIVTVN